MFSFFFSSFFFFFFFFFNDTATTEIYTLSLHDALPISLAGILGSLPAVLAQNCANELQTSSWNGALLDGDSTKRSEEHTSELQSRRDLVCRLLLEKKKKKKTNKTKYKTTKE